MKNVLSELKNLNERWASIGLGEVNGSPVSMRVMEDVEANFHTHDNADEFFLVLSGKVFIDTDSESIELNQGQSYTVAAGTKHRARAIGRSELIIVGGQDA
ncbi:cupin domain-containing protein [Marinimicrobium locisalis]|uniref:cupin domain-containing protein n=1 Tax=Marinimicrobium locisalis TaxID=546022 RepID=UPI003221EB97